MVLQRTIEDRERKASHNNPAGGATDTRCAIREQSDVSELSVHCIDEAYRYALTALCIPHCRVNDISIGLFANANRKGLHPRIAFNARARTWAGV